MVKIKKHVRKIGRKKVTVKAHTRKTKRKATPSRFMPRKAKPETLFLEELSFWRRQANSGPKTARGFASEKVEQLESNMPNLASKKVSLDIIRRSKVKKGVPKRDGSGRGVRANKGRGGCRRTK